MNDIIILGPIHFNPQLHKVESPGKKFRLSPVENIILQFLATHVNTVCTFSQLQSEVWGYSENEVSGLLKVHIRHLRQKIEHDPNNPAYILTVPGEGYKLVVSPD